MAEPSLQAVRPVEVPIAARLRQVGKIYHSPRGDIMALDKVDLDIHENEFLSLLGPSGCGKSTLLRCLAGLEEKSSGAIEVNGTLVNGPPDHLGIVFQRDVLLDWRTVLDNLLLPIEFRRKSRAAFRDAALALLDLFGLTRFAHRFPWELSGGMRQRVAICRGLVHDPEVLLMDEPFSALDTITRDQMNVMLMQIWERFKRTALFVTHSIREAAYLSDRVIVMGRRPSQIICDEVIRFPRPRPLSIMDSAEFTALCAKLRAKIDEAHGFDSDELH